MRLRLTPIVEQLRAAGFRQVQGVLELPGADEVPRALPALYVVPAAEAAGTGAQRTGDHDQLVSVDFSVVLVVEGRRRHADGVAEDLSVEGERIKAAIAGWTHPDASRACSFVDARLGSAAGPAVVWPIRFRAAYHLRTRR